MADLKECAYVHYQFESSIVIATKLGLRVPCITLSILVSMTGILSFSNCLFNHFYCYIVLYIVFLFLRCITFFPWSNHHLSAFKSVSMIPKISIWIARLLLIVFSIRVAKSITNNFQLISKILSTIQCSLTKSIK